MSNRRVTITMTPDELRELIAQSVRGELERAGLLIEDADHREASRKDFTWLRSMRTSYDAAVRTAGKVVLGFILTAMLGALAVGVKLGLAPTPPNPKG